MAALLADAIITPPTAAIGAMQKWQETISTQRARRSFEEYADSSFSDWNIGTTFVPPAIVQQSGRRDAFVSVENFEGHVEDINEDGSFRARLSSLTSNNEPPESATFFADDVAEDDKPLVVQGAVFYWNIGRLLKSTGVIENRSVVRFRRLPRWTERELAQLKEQTALISEELGWAGSEKDE